MSEEYKFLKKATSQIAGVTYRSAYGLDAVFIKEKSLLLVTKEHRIVIKIEDQELLSKKRESIELNVFELNGKEMEHWYLIPKSYNKKKNRLIPLIESASSSLFKQRKRKRNLKKKKKVVHNTNNIELKALSENNKISFIERILRLFRK